MPQKYGRENTVETQVAKDIKEELTARESARSQPGDSDIENGNQSEKDRNKAQNDDFWKTYNSAVNDKVKYGELPVHEENPTQRTRKKAYGYPGGLQMKAASGKGR